MSESYPYRSRYKSKGDVLFTNLLSALLKFLPDGLDPKTQFMIVAMFGILLFLA